MNSQHSPERERHATRYNSLGPRNIPPLPPGLELMRPDGTFYPLVAGIHSIAISNGFVIGIQDASGILRPIFDDRTIVKVNRLGPGRYNFVPMTLQEYTFFNINSDLSTHVDPNMRYIAEVRRRASNLGRRSWGGR